MLNFLGRQRKDNSIARFNPEDEADTLVILQEN